MAELPGLAPARLAVSRAVIGRMLAGPSHRWRQTLAGGSDCEDHTVDRCERVESAKMACEREGGEARSEHGVDW